MMQRESQRLARPEPAGTRSPVPPSGQVGPFGSAQTPLGTDPPRVGPARAVLAPAGARGAPAGRWGAKTSLGPVAARLGGLGAVTRRLSVPPAIPLVGPKKPGRQLGEVPKSDPNLPDSAQATPVNLPT